MNFENYHDQVVKASPVVTMSLQERLKAAEAKRIEKERTEKYQKLKGDAKDARSKYREKVLHEITSVWYTCG